MATDSNRHRPDWLGHADHSTGRRTLADSVTPDRHAMTKIIEYNITNAGNKTPVQTVAAANSITIQLAADVHLLVINY
jgi:hypothetical protein